MDLEAKALQDWVLEWDRRVERVERARKEMEVLQGLADQASDAIAKSLSPGDMNVGEVIGAWVWVEKEPHRRLVTVTYHGHGSYRVSWRGPQSMGDGER